MALDIEGIPITPRWETLLSEDARVLVEKRRRRYIPEYTACFDEGFRVVAELSPTSGRLLAAGKRVGMIQQLEANDIIESLKGQDKLLGRRRQYDFLVGCVVPTRKDGTVTVGKDLHAYRRGISVIGRDMTPKEIEDEAAIVDLINTVDKDSRQVEHVIIFEPNRGAYPLIQRRFVYN